MVDLCKHPVRRRVFGRPFAWVKTVRSALYRRIEHLIMMLERERRRRSSRLRGGSGQGKQAVMGVGLGVCKEF
jgi:hypothetical protein